MKSDVWQMDGQTDSNPDTIEEGWEVAPICWDEMTKHPLQYAPANGHGTSTGSPHTGHVTSDMCGCCSGHTTLHLDKCKHVEICPKISEKQIIGSLHLYLLNKSDYAADYHDSFISKNFSDSKRQENTEEVCHFLSAVTI